MQRHAIYAAVFFLCFANTAIAQDYQADIELNYNELNYDDFYDETTTYNLTGRYYFSSVETRNHPLAEAAFLEKSNNITASYINHNVEFAHWLNSFSIVEDYNNQQTYAASIQYYLPNTPLFLSVGATQTEGNLFSSYSGEPAGEPPVISLYVIEEKDLSWLGSLGVTPIDGLLVWTDVEEDVSFDDSWNLNAKYVKELGTQAINLEARYTDEKNAYHAEIAGDFYLDRTLSIGASYSFYDYDDSDQYTVRARKFFTSVFSLQALAFRSDDVDGFALGLDYRI